MSLYPQDILDQILGRIDIAELIGSYIPLKKAGRNFKACCPFHHEKTASFMVSTDKQIYHCFGCGAGGNVFNFLIQYERMEFPEAVEFLARKAGIVLPEKKKLPGGGGGAAPGSSQAFYKINELAAGFFQKNLHSPAGQQAVRYLQKRGIDQKTAAEFRIGLALQAWDSFLLFARKEGVSEAMLEKAGLVLRNQENRLYDRFRSRLMFPIIDAKSSVVAFGGRVLDDSLPKYLNSPETPVYVKGRSVFGLNCAKEAIRQQDRVVIVEGYLDCIIPYQHGLHTIVASLGTALTVEQIRLLKRYTHQMFLVYDGDAAGQNATIRSLDLFLEEGLLPRIVALPQGFDPDSYVIKFGIERFRQLIDSASSLFEYKLKVLSGQHDRRSSEGKAAISGEILPMIRRIDSAVLRSEYIRRLGEHLSVAEEHLYAQLKDTKKSSARSGAALAAHEPIVLQGTALRLHPSEKMLLQLMLRETEYIAAVKDQLAAEDFQDERVCRIVELLYSFCGKGKMPEPASILEQIDNQELRRLICEATVGSDGEDKADTQVLLNDCIKRIKHCRRQDKQRHLHEEIKKAQSSHDTLRLRTLMEEFSTLVKRG